MVFDKQIVHGVATRSKERLSRNDTDDFREMIMITVDAYGQFDVWAEVFRDDSRMSYLINQCIDNQKNILRFKH